MTSASSSRLPSADVAASRTSACSAPSSGVSRANAGCAAFPIFPSVCAAIVRIFGVGSSSKEAQRGDGRGGGLAVTLDQLRRPRAAPPGCVLVQLADDDRQRLRPERTQGANGVDRLPLHPRVGVVEQGDEIAEQAVVARR